VAGSPAVIGSKLIKRPFNRSTGQRSHIRAALLTGSGVNVGTSRAARLRTLWTRCARHEIL
jgi:hypothetical protein